MRNITYLTLFLSLFLLSACQRIHTETSGGTQPKTQVKYDDKYVNTDPNLPGDRR